MSPICAHHEGEQSARARGVWSRKPVLPLATLAHLFASTADLLQGGALRCRPGSPKCELFSAFGGSDEEPVGVSKRLGTEVGDVDLSTSQDRSFEPQPVPKGGRRGEG